jgi:hypothetical protein
MNIGSLVIRFALDTIWVWAFGFAIPIVRLAKRKPAFTDETGWPYAAILAMKFSLAVCS